MSAKVYKTPIKSHISRRMSNFVEKSPLRKSINAISSPQHINNDDDAERARRRSCSELQKLVSNIGTLNRSSNVGVSSDSESCNISESSLEGHYETCVKLFTENKINTKNAWNLHIIEFMRTMLKKGLVMMDILKLASTSLDIGSKVYGLRVDDIHSDIFKLASAMARINIESEENRDDDDENAKASSDEEQNAAEKKKKEKKKRKRMSCDDENAELMIVKDENSINGTIIGHNTQCIGAASSGKERLYTLSMINKQKYGWEQLVNCRTNFKYWETLSDDSKDSKTTEFITANIPNGDGILCPSFMDFVIDQWSPDDDDVPFSTQQARSKSDEIVYDENGLPIPELDASLPVINDDHFNNDPFDEDVVEEMGAGQIGRRPPVAFITDMRPGDGPVSDKPLQYSYRAPPVMSNRYAIIGLWAGPSHWKIKSLQRPSTVNGQQNGIVNGAAQRGRRPTKPELQMIDFDDKFDDEFEKIFAPSKKKLKKTRQSVRCLDKVTLPEDLGVEKEDVCCLRLRPWLKQPLGGREAVHLNSSRGDINISTAYQYDNPNDADYCSQTQNDIAAADDHNDDDNGACDEQEMFGDDNMVDMPNIVQKTYVPYATQAKKMDMKKLKDGIWKTMASVSSGNDSILEDEVQLREATLDHVPFSKMYKELPNNITARMGEELSYPLAFVALLHLANEQTLKLEGQSDLLDFLISTDRPNSIH